ncbi:MAG: hypothetical protein ABI278_00175 [Candidatus Aquilonibacter sp.]
MHAGLAAIAFFPIAATAQGTPAQPSPSPSPTPIAGSITWKVDGQQLFIDQQTGGSGILPPEGAGFAAGGPLAPNTPYDTWSGAPEVPGLAGIFQYRATPQYNARRIFASVDLGFGFVTGSVTNAAYWGENLLPTYNPHLGNGALPYAIVFPSNANGDRGNAFRASILGASAGAQDGSWTAKAGYFDLAQTARFIFIQPAFTNVTPSLGIAPAESLGNGAPALAWWPSPEPGLPLLGADVTLRRGIGSLELTDAELPALRGTNARVAMGSLVIDHGEGTRYTAQFSHVTTGGAPISTTTMFGSDAMTVPGPQGNLPVSTLGGQRATIAGASVTFHATRTISATLELGKQWYDADEVIEPGSQRPGGFYHVALSREAGRATTTVEGFRFEPRYATTILPYGIPENIWSSAWSWPGPWLKSNYEVNDNSQFGVNREGYRVKYSLDGGPLELHVQIMRNRQIEEATLSNVYQTGFVDGFFLPQLDGFGTRGEQAQYSSWIAWHPHFGTLTLDYVVDVEHRSATPAHPEDLVDYVAPQAMLAYSHQLSGSTIVAGGYGYYAMKGTWATTPLNFGEATYFIGAELQESKQSGLFVQLRHNSFGGTPSSIGGTSPGFGANLLIVEQRLHIEP